MAVISVEVNPGVFLIFDWSIDTVKTKCSGRIKLIKAV